jgi:hypothetical protein
MLGRSAKPGSIEGRSATSGRCHGSEEFARNVSVRRITGVRYFTAIRHASKAASKQFDGVNAATMGRGDSPCRPYIASRRSAASVLVGMPVEGPARWTLTMTMGSSRATASPIVSAFRSRPGPLVPVTPRCPANAAPMAMLAAAISSSAWNVRTPKFLCFDSSCSSSDAGVIGYDA